VLRVAQPITWLGSRSSKERLVMTDHTADPDARSWDDLEHDLGLSAAERGKIDTGAQRLIAEARASRLSEVRRRQHITQVEVAKEMGVTQARISWVSEADQRAARQIAARMPKRPTPVEQPPERPKRGRLAG
jgi:hypothetical protein